MAAQRRRLVRLRSAGVGLVTAVLAIGLAGASIAPVNAAPQAKAKAKSSITISVSQTSVTSGAKVVVTGKLRRAGKAYARQPVVLQWRKDGTKSWTKVKTVKTNARGVVRVKTPAVKQNRQLRWSFAGNRKTKSKVSAAVKVKVKVKVPASKDWVVVDQWTRSTTPAARVTVSGRTGPEVIGEVLWLQSRAPGATSWTDNGGARVDASGRFLFDEVPSQFYGNVDFRILNPRGAAFPAIPVGKVEVFEYVASSGVTWLDEENIYTTTTRKVNGVPYTYTWANADAKETWSVWAPKQVGWATVLAGKVAVEDGTGTDADRKSFRVTVWNKDNSITVRNFGPTARGAEPIAFRVDVSQATKFEIRILAGGGSATGFFTHLGVLYAD